MLCTKSDAFIILAYSELYLFRYVQVSLRIFSIIKAYSLKLRYFLGIFRLIQAYSAPLVTFVYSQSCHTPSPGMFRTGGIFKTLWNFDQTYSELYHSQNGLGSLFKHYSAAFAGIFGTLCNTCICRNLAFSESWKIQNSSIIAS